MLKLACGYESFIPKQWQVQPLVSDKIEDSNPFGAKFEAAFNAKCGCTLLAVIPGDCKLRRARQSSETVFKEGAILRIRVLQSHLSPSPLASVRAELHSAPELDLKEAAESPDWCRFHGGSPGQRTIVSFPT